MHGHHTECKFFLCGFARCFLEENLYFPTDPCPTHTHRPHCIPPTPAGAAWLILPKGATSPLICPRAIGTPSTCLAVIPTVPQACHGLLATRSRMTVCHTRDQCDHQPRAARPNLPASLARATSRRRWCGGRAWRLLRRCGGGGGASTGPPSPCWKRWWTPADAGWPGWLRQTLPRHIRPGKR